MDEEILQPEPNEVGPGGSVVGELTLPGINVLPMAGDLPAPSDAIYEGLSSDLNEVAANIKAAESMDTSAASSPLGEILAALLPAALGAAVDGKRGALIASGGAAKQLLTERKEEQDAHDKLLKRLRDRREALEKARRDESIRLQNIGEKRMLTDLGNISRYLSKPVIKNIFEGNKLSLSEGERKRITSQGAGIRKLQDLRTAAAVFAEKGEVEYQGQKFVGKNGLGRLANTMLGEATAVADAFGEERKTNEDITRFRLAAEGSKFQDGFEALKQFDLIIQNFSRDYGYKLELIEGLALNPGETTAREKAFAKAATNSQASFDLSRVNTPQEKAEMKARIKNLRPGSKYVLKLKTGEFKIFERGVGEIKFGEKF